MVCAWALNTTVAAGEAGHPESYDLYGVPVCDLTRRHFMDEGDDAGEHIRVGIGQHAVAEVEDVPGTATAAPQHVEGDLWVVNDDGSICCAHCCTSPT